MLDPIFPQPDSSNNRKYSLIPQEIRYTLIFDEEVEGPQLRQMRENDVRGVRGIGIIDEIESDQEDDLGEGENGAK